MKQHLTVFLLFISLCFYGQEVVEMEGFYKYEKLKWYLSPERGYHTEERFYFYEIFAGWVIQPVRLKIPEEQYKQIRKIKNTAFIKIKALTDNK